jgi:hypothetical protein
VSSANRIASEPQDIFLNMLPVTFIQAINDNGHWLGKTVTETWFDDQPVKLFSKGPVHDGRVFLDYEGDELPKFRNQSASWYAIVGNSFTAFPREEWPCLKKKLPPRQPLSFNMWQND